MGFDCFCIVWYELYCWQKVLSAQNGFLLIATAVWEVLRPTHCVRDKVAAILEVVFSNGFPWIFFLIFEVFTLVPNSPINNKPTLVQIMAWRFIGLGALTHIGWWVLWGCKFHGVFMLLDLQYYLKLDDGSSPLIWNSSLGPILLTYSLTLISRWISDHIPGKVWDEITYPFQVQQCGTILWRFIIN